MDEAVLGGVDLLEPLGEGGGLGVGLGFVGGGAGGEQFGEAFFAAGGQGAGGEGVAQDVEQEVFAGGDGAGVVGGGGYVPGVGRVVLAHVVGVGCPGRAGWVLVTPHIRRWQILHRMRDRSA